MLNRVLREVFGPLGKRYVAFCLLSGLLLMFGIPDDDFEQILTGSAGEFYALGNPVDDGDANQHGERTKPAEATNHAMITLHSATKAEGLHDTQIYSRVVCVLLVRQPRSPPSIHTRLSERP